VIVNNFEAAASDHWYRTARLNRRNLAQEKETQNPEIHECKGDRQAMVLHGRISPLRRMP
jgi:hypothetical protein